MNYSVIVLVKRALLLLHRVVYQAFVSRSCLSKLSFSLGFDSFAFGTSLRQCGIRHASVHKTCAFLQRARFSQCWWSVQMHLLAYRHTFKLYMVTLTRVCFLSIYTCVTCRPTLRAIYKSFNEPLFSRTCLLLV